MSSEPLSLISFSQPFAECSKGPCVFHRFPTTPLENVREYGAIPVWSWSSQGSRDNVREPDFRLARFAVDSELDPHARHRSSPRPARTRRACRR